MPKRESGQTGEEGERLRRLHGGRHSLSAEMVAHNQRERLLAAMAAVCAERGYAATTITHVTEAAEVSRRTFYEHFDGKEECFFAAYDVLDDYLGSLMEEAKDGQDGWPDQVAAALAATVHYLASRPAFARLYLVEAAALGDAMLSRREKTAQRLISLLEPGREHGGRERLSEGIEEALAGGVFTLLARRTLAGEGDQLDRFIPAVVEFALAPYLGAEEARAVAERHP